MNNFFTYIIIILLVFDVNAQDQKSPKNVLFIMVDDLRPELNIYYKDHIKSPNIDKLASNGITFDRAYCNVPVCGASRASLLSGVRPTRERFLNYFSSVNEAGPEIKNIVDYFNERGYLTVSNNKITHLKNDIKSWDEEWYPKDISWRNYQDPENRVLDINNKPASAYEKLDVNDSVYFDSQTANKSISDLKKMKDSHKPFFLAVGFVKPHLPFTAPKKYWDLYDRSQIKLPENSKFPETAPAVANHKWGELRYYKNIPKKGPIPDDLAITLIHAYYASVSFVDAQIGKLINALDELKLRENTIIVLVGDHGWSLSDHGLWAKHSNFEVALRVPLIISSPGLKKNKKTKSIAELVDLYPTLCDLTNGEKPNHLHGYSLLESMNNPSKIFKIKALSRWQKGETLIRQNLFYTEWKLPNRTVKMLFDHSVDPNETINLANLKRYNDVVTSLSNELEKLNQSFK